MATRGQIEGALIYIIVIIGALLIGALMVNSSLNVDYDAPPPPGYMWTGQHYTTLSMGPVIALGIPALLAVFAFISIKRKSDWKLENLVYGIGLIVGGLLSIFLLRFYGLSNTYFDEYYAILTIPLGIVCLYLYLKSNMI